MSRLPIRMRLTLAFALAMAAVLVATGAFLYFRLESSLDEGIDVSLEARAADVAALIERGQLDLGGSGGELDERFVQVLDLDGRVVDATPQVGDQPLISQEELARERSGIAWFERDAVPGIDGRVRFLATYTDVTEETLLLLVGASLEDRDETLRGFFTELLLIGPAALVLASLLGYGLATAALRPVESMRAEAAEISAAEPGRRLPLPESRDEVRRLGETLNAMLERLERALERERSFVADASHELRTPLALLKTELELALRHPRSAAELEGSLRSAAAETDRLVRLAEDLLVLTRSDQGRLALRRAPVSASELLSDVAERFELEVEKAARAIEVAVPDGLRVVGDEARLEQALGNLVENALRHGRGSIRLSAVATGGAVELHVRDEGAGFPPEFLPRAFERFTRADEARSGGGTGLGLAIVQAIASAHGGSAHAANRGPGADVWLSLARA